MKGINMIKRYKTYTQRYSLFKSIQNYDADMHGIWELYGGVEIDKLTQPLCQGQ